MSPLRAITEKPRLYQKLLVAATVVMFLSLLIIYFTIVHLQHQVGEVLKNPLNILVLGVDQAKLDEQGEEELPRTDTMLFMAVRPKMSKVAVFSIPRDSLVEIPGYGVDRINMAHVYGGYPLTKLMVEKIMEMPVDGYVMLNFEGFKEVVDLIGGVEITVDKRMLYEDKSAGFIIDLHPGLQKLDGNDALGYVRFRRDALGDITRTKRQQQFIMALLAKIKQKETLMRVLGNLPEIKKLSDHYFQTNLQLKEILGLGLLFEKLNPQENIVSTTLPGEFSGPYWRLHPQKIRYLTEPFSTN